MYSFNQYSENLLNQEPQWQSTIFREMTNLLLSVRKPKYLQQTGSVIPNQRGRERFCTTYLYTLVSFVHAVNAKKPLKKANANVGTY